MDAFDADVLIFAAAPEHRIGARVRSLIDSATVERSAPVAGVGSVLLLTELLAKPLRDGNDGEIAALAALLARIDLRPVDHTTALLATSLAATYRLRAADATHLATAVAAGADRFITNNASDFTKSITEIAITYPGDLPDP